MAAATPRLLCQVFSLSKRGNRVEENEDACAHNAVDGRFAIADGATESSFAGQWARLLVDEFVKAATPSEWAGWLPGLQARWAATVDHQPMPWYAETKVQQGAFATFLGVVVEEDCWRAVAVGDSCLFHLRNGTVRCAFPVQRSEDFGSAPWLIGSRGFNPASMIAKELRQEDDWRAGDRLWLMTDALSQWFLQRLEADKKSWHELAALLEQKDPAGAFTALVAKLRGSQALRNDDVTWLTVAEGI